MNEFENNQNFQDSPNQNTQNENINTSYVEPSLPKQVPQSAPTYTTPYNNYTAPKKQKNTHSTAVVIVSCILAALIGAASAVVVIKNPLFINTETSQSEYKQQNSKAETQKKEENKPQNNISINVEESASSIAEAVAKKCSNSVVGIRTTTSVTSFFGGTQEQNGDGSGVVYSEDGYIITNYHVISSALTSQNPKIDVFVGDSQSDSYPATVVGYNISCDLAVIKIDTDDNLVPIEFANSDDLQVGQNVVTIGAPGGLEFMGSVTYGIISGLDRTVSTSAGLKLIQTDAAINPGNSGGALLNSEGKLVGINSSKIASVEYEGMGFAIPVNTVKEKCDKIISHQGDSAAYLGVSISSTYTSEVLNYYGFPTGAVVSSVFEGSPAAKAGIKRGDIITEFNNVEISEYTVLGDALYDCEPNDTVSITIYRNGKNYTVNVKLTSDTSN